MSLKIILRNEQPIQLIRRKKKKQQRGKQLIERFESQFLLQYENFISDMCV